MALYVCKHIVDILYIIVPIPCYTIIILTNNNIIIIFIIIDLICIVLTRSMSQTFKLN